jgi:peptidoglycan-associated lipoprotein
MKKILFTASLAVLLFVGCGEKEPDSTDAESTATTKDSDKLSSRSIDNASNNISTLTADSINEINKQFHSVYFDYDKFNVKSSMNSKLESNAGLSKKVAKASAITRLEGNCDEWGSDEYNFALGLKRAKSVKTKLVNFGVPEDNIVIVSLGESSPKCQEKTQSCWAKNRRVDSKIVK